MAKSKQVITVAALATLLAPAVAVYQPTQPTAAQSAFADSAFERVWNRNDKLVADRTVTRSWYWDPAPG